MSPSKAPIAQIAGGGISGLGLAIALRRNGWRVTVHEQGDTLREVGAGIYLKHNLIRVLERLGVAEEVFGLATPLERSLMRDGRRGTVLQNIALTGTSRLWMCSRETLIRTLESKASDSGAAIKLNSPVLGAVANGLETRAGTMAGDLIVGADGVGSKVRDSLPLRAVRTRLPTIATRYLVPLPLETRPYTTMFWSGKRRVGLARCNNGTYVYMICPESDTHGIRVPMDVDSWTESFPVIADILREIASFPAIQHNYAIVKCDRWSHGATAVVGDAAHGLPPLLGQGAGLALSNAYSLASAVGSSSEGLAAKLHAWEDTYRGIADKTQWWSMHLDRITNAWPSSLDPLRKAYLWILGAFPPVQSRMKVADRYPLAD